MGVDDLKRGGLTATSDHDKAEVVSPVFFPAIREMRNDHQRSIDITWRMLCPPREPASVEVTPREVIAAIRRMRTGAALGLGWEFLLGSFRNVCSLFCLGLWWCLVVRCIVAMSRWSGP